MDTKQSEAFRLVEELEDAALGFHRTGDMSRCQNAKKAIRTHIAELEAQVWQCGAGAGCCAQAARIEALEAQLEAVGAGGVGPLLGAPAQAVALLVRKKSWLDGQWECAPKGFGNYGMQWADERMWVYAAPQPPAQALDALKQVCAIAVSAAKTNSRDIADWREDMDRIAAIAAQQGDKT